LGGAGVKTSRRAGSGFGLGLGAFFASFLPLSLLPMSASVPQKGGAGKDEIAALLSVEMAGKDSAILLAAAVV